MRVGSAHILLVCMCAHYAREWGKMVRMLVVKDVCRMARKMFWGRSAKKVGKFEIFGSKWAKISNCG